MLTPTETVLKQPGNMLVFPVQVAITFSVKGFSLAITAIETADTPLFWRKPSPGVINKQRLSNPKR